jgi:HEPN domain-containing protein
MDNSVYVREWFRKADNDYGSAEYLFGRHPMPVDVICFLCEQAVEKWLKGYLASKNNNEPPKSHNLAVLCEKCADIEKSFIDLNTICVTLSPYGVTVRYPSELEVTELDAKRAFEYAKTVKGFAPLGELKTTISEDVIITEYSATTAQPEQQM